MESRSDQTERSIEEQLDWIESKSARTSREAATLLNRIRESRA